VPIASHGRWRASLLGGVEEPCLQLKAHWIKSWPLLQWRFSALVEAGSSKRARRSGSSKRLVEAARQASYIETRQMQAALKMQINKTCQLRLRLMWI
jgi:hypothetical protein